MLVFIIILNLILSVISLNASDEKFDVDDIIEKIGLKSYETEEVHQQLSDLPYKIQTKAFAQTLVKLLEGIRSHQSDVILALSNISPQYYTADFAEFVLTGTGEEVDGSRRVEVMQKLSKKAPETIPLYKDLCHVIFDEITHDKFNLASFILDLPAEYLTENFIKLLRSLTENNKSGYGRLKFMRGLTYFKNLSEANLSDYQKIISHSYFDITDINKGIKIEQMDTFYTLLVCFYDYMTRDSLVLENLSTCIAFANARENLDDLNAFLNKIQKKYRINAPIFFVLYHNNPALMDKAIQIVDNL
ncbi:MAG: hypothetical protein Q8K36_03335, partial [Alphaproteobacteria bacterium]|nr:hypothetical protein [Alphaproteobacteria bacterium]